MKNKIPAHLIQTNHQRTMVRLPSVVGFDESDLVVVPTGEIMVVGSLLMRDRGTEKRELLMTNRTGSRWAYRGRVFLRRPRAVTPIKANGNVFH